METVKLKKVGTLPLCLPCRPYYCSTTFPLDKPIPSSILGTWSNQIHPYGYAGETDTKGKKIKFYYIGEFTGDIGIAETGVKAIKFFATINGEITNEVTGVVLTSYIKNYYWDKDNSKGYIAPLFKYSSEVDDKGKEIWPDDEIIKNEGVEVNKNSIDLTKISQSQLPWYEIRFAKYDKQSDNTPEYRINTEIAYDGNRSNINANIDYSWLLIDIFYPASYCRTSEPVWKKIPESVFSWNIIKSPDIETYTLGEHFNQLGFPSKKLIGQHLAALNITKGENKEQPSFEAIGLRQVNKSSDFGYILTNFIEDNPSEDNPSNEIKVQVGDLFTFNTNESNKSKCLKIDKNTKYWKEGTTYIIQKLFENNKIAAFSYYRGNNNITGSSKKIIGLVDISTITLSKSLPEVTPSLDLLATQEDYKQLFCDLLKIKCADYATSFYGSNSAFDDTSDNFYFSFSSSILSNIASVRKWEQTCQTFWNIFYSLLFFFGYDVYSETLTQSEAKENLLANYNFTNLVSAEAEQLSDIILSVLSKTQSFTIDNKRYTFHQNFYQLRISKDKIELAYLESQDNPQKIETTSNTGIETTSNTGIEQNQQNASSEITDMSGD